MSFLVLVLGMLLSLGGAAALYSGYANVEVVRGWTAVIAGTTALSAGVMTIGISFILRCLVRLQAFLEIERGLAALLNEIALNRDAYYPRARPTGFEGAAANGGQPAALVAAATSVTIEVCESEAGGDGPTEHGVESRKEPSMRRAGTNGGLDMQAKAPEPRNGQGEAGSPLGSNARRA
jgi:hypothetical protein